LGYAIGDVSSEAIEDALVKKTVILNNVLLAKLTNNTTEETMYKVTMDLTNVDYLIWIVSARAEGAADGTAKLYFGAVEKASQTESVDEEYGTDQAYALHTIDCTSVTGDTVISITGDSDVNAYMWCYCYLYAMES